MQRTKIMRSTRYNGDSAWDKMRGQNNPNWETERRGETAQAAAATVTAAAAEVDYDTGDHFSNLTGEDQLPFGD